MQLSELPKTRAEAKALSSTTYYTGKSCKYGHKAFRFSANGDCAKCSRLKSSRAYYENPEKNKEYAKQWVAANKEKRKEISRNYARRNRDKQKEYAARNKEQVASTKRRWKLKNKEATSAHTRNRRAKIRGAEGRHTKSDVDVLYAAQSGMCVVCHASLRDGYHVDHIVAISRGGSNWPSNLQLLCAPCNVSKSDKDFLEWFGQRVYS